MKTTFLIFSVLLSSFTAFAQAPDPCAPTVHAKPSRIYCADSVDHYTILLDTYMSPAACLSQGKYTESTSAKIEISDAKNEVVGTVELSAGVFKYELGQAGMDNSSFDSDRPAMHLNKCITPAYGAGSFGN